MSTSYAMAAPSFVPVAAPVYAAAAAAPVYAAAATAPAYAAAPMYKAAGGQFFGQETGDTMAGYGVYS